MTPFLKKRIEIRCSGSEMKAEESKLEKGARAFCNTK